MTSKPAKRPTLPDEQPDEPASTRGIVMPKMEVYALKETVFPARGWRVETSWGVYWRQMRFPKDPWHLMVTSHKWVKINYHPEGIESALISFRSKRGAVRARARGNRNGAPIQADPALKAKFFRLLEAGVPVTVTARTIGIDPNTGFRWRREREAAQEKKSKLVTPWKPRPPPPLKRTLLDQHKARDKRIWELRREGKSFTEVHALTPKLSKPRVVQIFRQQELFYQRELLEKGIPDPLPPMPDRIIKNQALRDYRDQRIWEMRKEGKSYMEIRHIIGDDLSLQRIVGIFYEQEKKRNPAKQPKQENEHDQHELELGDVAGEPSLPTE